VTYGGKPIRTVPLSMSQHLGCMFLGALILPFSFLIKRFIHLRFIPQIYLKDQPLSEEEISTSFQTRFRKGKRIEKKGFSFKK